MKDYATDKVRNIGLVGHGSSGKTSLVEAALFAAKVTSRLGSVDSGNTVSDYAEDEIIRKISIGLTLANFDWKGFKINLIDMPGYTDFFGEVVCGLRAADVAMVAINGVTGPEVGTDMVWRVATKSDLPRAFFINRLDKEHADFAKWVSVVQENYSTHAVPVVISWGDGLTFKGVIDLLKMKAVSFEKDGSGKLQDIPADFKDAAQKWHDKMVEAAAEADEALMEKFFDQGTLSEDEIKQGLIKGIANRMIFPIFAGSAATLAGVSTMLDFATMIFPAPDYLGEIRGKDGEKEYIRKIAVDGPTSALIFKTVSEPHVGEMSFFKAFSGSVKVGDDLYNTTTNSHERIGQIFVLNGKDRQEAGKIAAGDIGALVKLKSSRTGDTLAEKHSPIQYPLIDIPRPVIRMALRSKAKGDEEKIASGLAKLRDEDPTIQMIIDPDIKQTLLAGQGELHLDVVCDRLKRKFGVEVELIKPRIPYRSTIRKKVEVQGKFKRQTGGRGQYGDCWLRLEPLPKGKDFEFVDAVVGGSIPGKFLPSVEKGVVEAREEAGLAATKVVDFRVTCFDGSYHNVDSSDMAFKIAASMGFKDGISKADPYLLEPLYIIEVLVPDDFMGDVMGDISSRRGKIIGMEGEGKMKRIKAQVPLAELYKYSTTLRSLTQGRGTHTREFSHYEEVPREISARVVEDIEKARAEEEKEK
jgi:elongation factor G